MNLDEIKSKIRSGKIVNSIFVDAAHGTFPPAAVFEMMVNPNLNEGVSNTLFLHTGEEQERQIKEYAKLNNVDLRVKSFWSDLCTVKSVHPEYGIVDVTMDGTLFNNINLIVVWSVNNLTEYLFDKLLDITYNIPIIFIGDNHMYCESSYISSKLESTTYYLSEITRTPSFNLEVIYWNKRIRTGNINRLELTQHRSYNILIKRDEEIQPLEFMNYDVTITCRSDYRLLNNNIRDTLGFGMEPRLNEPMLMHDAAIVYVDGEKIYIAPYTIMKVREVVNDNGLMFVTFNYKDKLIKLLVNTEYLSKCTGLTDSDYRVYGGVSAVRCEPAYVILPRHCLNKSFDRVQLLYTDVAHISSKKIFYQLSMCVREKFTLCTDYLYSIY